MNTVLLEEFGVKMRLARLFAILVVALLSINACACAQGAIDTTVVMRVSRMTQNAVVDVGEDLSIEVNIDGVTPEAYQWYFNDEPIQGATQKVLNIVDAQPEDAGIYRLDAFDASGAMVVSMDISARVVKDEVPQSGDSSMPVGYAFAGMLACAAALTVLLRRRAML
jgi:hypothetical protein